MEWIASGLLTLLVLGLGGLAWLGGCRLKKGSAGQGGRPPDTWPLVSVIIPVKEMSVVASEGLRSLMAQDHLDFEVLLVTEDDSDASAIHDLLCESVVSGCRRRLHVVAGRAATCGQKNFNLLAGIRAADSERPVLVFCDAGHVAPPDWLRKMVAPLAAGQADVTTGYHYIEAKQHSVASAGRAITVRMLQLLQQIPGLTQPWGGATAMRRALFEELNLAEFWAKQVVDDVSLAQLLNEKRKRVLPVPEAVARTPFESQTFAGWSDWLFRQLFYLKVYFPVAWLVGGVAGYASAVLLIMNLGSLPGAIPWVLFLLLVAWLRRYHPAPAPLSRWLAGGVAAIFVACACHARTLFTRRMVWRDIAYRVARDGSVTGYRLPPER